MLKSTNRNYHTILMFFLLAISGMPLAGVAGDNPGFNGVWVINDKLSDDTDRQVEKAIKAAGGKIRHGGKKGKGRYKGGPENQELYDHISYDEILHFRYSAPEFRFIYADEFERVFFSDGRGRVASASGSSRSDRRDYSFAYWEGDKLLVESRPRDGGRINEIYSLEPGGEQLRVELHLKPLSFGAPIDIVRIYDRSTSE